MQHIDLSLAVNYIPACSCMFRLLVYLCTQTLLKAYEDDRTLVLGAIILYLDRVFQNKAAFFDSNAILYTVFFADIFQDLRQDTTHVDFSVFLAYFLWGCSGFVFLCDKKLWNGVAYLDNTSIQVVLSSFFLLYILNHEHIQEPNLCHTAKSVMFVVLVIVWIYVIGLKYMPINNQRYLVRFLPVIVIPIWMSIVYSMVCLVYIAWIIKQNLAAPERLPVIHEEPDPTDIHAVHEQQEENDLEAMFRLAKAAAGKNP